ncbi:TetR/AcrR family transcriptional regulator [Rhodophyticola sp. CCM32]|uniref:TetR/AcrR family transcriptional regulator n=1 Tax=Rhodophyticola sp. CCM32 TaxID=2916397 RepID=UPI00107F9527|nr:TetR/AcrR family transcriptional regulator [Rhodophyticola sp. CCM32]QBY00893.1 TetR/AcrR family transcriptional regulator [Rhodophyticola sp. CCM32]
MGTEKEARVRGPGRTTREDWMQIALDTLISDGVEAVKVLALAEKLKCARSSFYWYFKNRSDLLDSLLDHWQSTNTDALVRAANQPADSINFALGHLFSCWVNDGKFDTRLDFAVRDWARRSGTVRRAVDISDASRIAAVANMFERFEYPRNEADVRARIVYFTQIGYDALDQREKIEDRAARSRDYLFCMTGQEPSEAEICALKDRTLGDTSHKKNVRA